MADGIGDEFQQQTRYQRDAMQGGRLLRGAQPSPHKRYPDATTVALPDPQTAAPERAFCDVVASRRSVRNFADQELRLEALSFMLWASTGVRERANGYEFRTAPSAGALYPIETYVIANRIEGIARGVYHYGISKHVLELVSEGDMRRPMALAALNQQMCYYAGAVIVWTAVFERTKWKYGQRGYRYVYLDAGHIAAQFALAAVARGLGSCQIGALYDDEVNAIVGADGIEEGVVYMTAVGVKEAEAATLGSLRGGRPGRAEVFALFPCEEADVVHVLNRGGEACLQPIGNLRDGFRFYGS